jgi:hypothetical protein
MQIP